MPDITRHKTCPRCGSGFSCGAELSQTGHACWCSDLPPLKHRSAAGCLCPGCLTALVAEQAAGQSNPVGGP
jgi:uncharacterized protein